jgi:hypothetical protein
MNMVVVMMMMMMMMMKVCNVFTVKGTINLTNFTVGTLFRQYV